MFNNYKNTFRAVNGYWWINKDVGESFGIYMDPVVLCPGDKETLFRRGGSDSKIPGTVSIGKISQLRRMVLKCITMIRFQIAVFFLK